MLSEDAEQTGPLGINLEIGERQITRVCSDVPLQMNESATVVVLHS